MGAVDGDKVSVPRLTSKQEQLTSCCVRKEATGLLVVKQQVKALAADLNDPV